VSQELQAAANRLRTSLVTECGDRTYLFRPEEGPGALVELKNSSMKVLPGNLSEADRLNGLQLRGSAVFTAMAYRNDGSTGWSDNPFPSNDARSDLPHAIAGYEMRKIGGKWYYGDQPYARFDHDHGMYLEIDLANAASRRPVCEH